jgi:hypothetical protein
MNTELIDARGVVWEPLPDDEFRALSNDLPTWIKDQGRRQEVLNRLAAASRPGASQLRLKSCLARSDTPLICGKRYGGKRYDPENPEELAAFKKELHDYIGKLACESPEIAQGLVRQIPQEESDSSRQGLEVVLKNLLDDKNKECAGLQGLGQEWKDKLRAIK